MEVPDDVTGLTEREIDAVRESWIKLAVSWKTKGVEFFFKMFQTYPQIRAFFKAVDGLEMEEVRKSSKLRAHAINFQLGISSLIDNLDDPECLVVLIQKLATNHFRRQIKVEHFQDAFGLFVDFAQDVDELNEFTVAAWRKTLDAVVKVIEEHMAALDKQTNSRQMCFIL